MPWSAADAPKHNKDCEGNAHLSEVWASTANAALDEYDGDEGKAIATANAAVADEKKKGRKDEDFILVRDMGLWAEPKSFDPKSRTADAIISVGAPVRRTDFWTGESWDEVLDMQPQSIRLARLNQGAQLLDGHNAFGGLKSILGAVVPGTARVEEGKLRARFKFSRSEGGQRVAQDLADGIPLLLSAGYRTHRETRDRSTTPETRIAMDWEPLEVSVVPVAAEGGETGFRSLIDHRAPPIHKEHTMPLNLKPSDGALTEDQIRADEREKILKAQREEAEAKQRALDEEKRRADEADKLRLAERTRVREITKVFREAKLDVKLADECIERGDTVEAACKIATDALTKRGLQISGANGGGQGDVEVLRDERAGEPEAMAEAMTIRVLQSRRDVPGVNSAEQAEWVKRMGRVDMVARSRLIYDGHEKPQNERTREFLGMSMVEIAARCIGWKRSILPGNVAEIFQRAYGMRAGASHSVGDFPAIFENVLNKALLARYTLAMPTYRSIATERQFADFRPHPQIRAGEFPTLLPLTETGEVQAGTTSESKETVSVKPYGRTFSISRMMMVNDEMGAIDQILGSAGDRVLRFENATFFDMLKSNPTLVQDTTAVFDGSHNNLASPGGNPSVKTISAGRKAIREQTSLSGEPLNVPVSVILAGTVQETAVDQMLTSITPVTFTNVNPFSGKLTHINDALITDDSWYLFCSPASLPCFVYGFLAGQTGPRTRTDQPFGFQGLAVELTHDFGVGAIDFRGCYKDEGAGASGEGY